MNSEKNILSEAFKFYLRNFYIVTSFYYFYSMMTLKQRRNFANVIGICSLLTLLWGCQKSTETIWAISPTNTSTIQDAEVQETTNQDTTNLDTSTTVQQTISINDRCRWCGKCARIAPETFSMQNGKAEIISQDHIGETQVQQAIMRCNERAIDVA